MNILFIEKISFLTLLFEELFKEEGIYTRSEIDDCLYLVADLEIEMLIIDADCVDNQFWNDLSETPTDGVKIVIIGSKQHLSEIPITPTHIMVKPLEVETLKEQLTQVYNQN